MYIYYSECTQGKRIKIMVTHEIPLTKLSVLKKNGNGEACKLNSTTIDGCEYVEGVRSLVCIVV